MIGLNATKKIIKSFLMDKKKSQDILQAIKNQIDDHIGKYALLKEKNGRNICVYFIRIINSREGEYSCYDSRGKFRCFLRKFLDITQIMTDKQRLVFLDL